MKLHGPNNFVRFTFCAFTLIASSSKELPLAKFHLNSFDFSFKNLFFSRKTCQLRTVDDSKAKPDQFYRVLDKTPPEKVESICHSRKSPVKLDNLRSF